MKDPKITQIFIQNWWRLEYFQLNFNKECRHDNICSDAVPELPHGTVAGSALCAFRYKFLHFYPVWGAYW